MKRSTCALIVSTVLGACLGSLITIAVLLENKWTLVISGLVTVGLLFNLIGLKAKE